MLYLQQNVFCYVEVDPPQRYERTIYFGAPYILLAQKSLSPSLKIVFIIKYLALRFRKDPFCDVFPKSNKLASRGIFYIGFYLMRKMNGKFRETGK